MTIDITFVSSASLLPPALVAAARFSQVRAVYHPFLVLLWVGLLNEVISTYVTKPYTAPNTNVYFLAEALLLVLFFARLRPAALPPRRLGLLVAGLALWWLTEAILVGIRRAFLSYFIIVHALVIVLLSIEALNHLIGSRQKNLLKNAVFLLCCCFIVYFTYAVLVEIVWTFSDLFSQSFKASIQTILSIINIGTNLVFALAILWMPKKHDFSLLSSWLSR